MKGRGKGKSHVPAATEFKRIPAKQRSVCPLIECDITFDVLRAEVQDQKDRQRHPLGEKRFRALACRGQ